MQHIFEDHGHQKIYRPGDRIFREGEHASHAYIVERGTVEITTTRDDRLVRIARIGPGEIFGEMALIDNNVRSANAVAADECELIIIRREQIQTVLRNADMTLKMLLEVLLGRFRSMQGRISIADADLPSADADNEGVVSSLRRQYMRGYGYGYEPDHQHAIDRLKFEKEIEKAIAEQAFVADLQPIVSLIDGMVCGYEALIRWPHAKRGSIPPTEFIGLAENSLLIRAIDRLMLRTAVQMIKSGAAGDAFVSVNLSGVSFADGGILREAKAVLAETGVDPGRLRIEITEGILSQSPPPLAAILEGFASTGIRIALDDFGTGWSSLNNLIRFPLHAVKIDRTVIRDMLAKDQGEEIVRTMVGMAHNLGMAVIAEGIETSEQLQRLWQMRCEFGQGFLLCPPAPPEEAFAFAGAGPVLSKGPVLLREAGNPAATGSTGTAG